MGVSFFDHFRARPAALDGARHGDSGLIAAIHAGAFHRGWTVAEIDGMLADPAIVAEVARADGGRGLLVGFSIARLAGDEAEILSIAVSARVRGGGIGGQLLAATLAKLAARGARRVFLEVEAGNAPAIALYRRYGFAEVGRRRAYYQTAERKADALVMRRDL